MRVIDHANDILGFLARRRDAKHRIAPITNTELLVAMGRQPGDYAVTYGQASSLLDLASMEAGQPFIGRLILFDHRDDTTGAWENWLPFARLLYSSTPRLKTWSDTDLAAIRTHLRLGKPSNLWKAIENESEVWLQRALSCAQEVIGLHVDSLSIERSDDAKPCVPPERLSRS